MNKRMTIKKIMLWLYAMLLCLPLIQVGFRCAYVALNKNAYESYKGEIQFQRNVNLEKPSDILPNETYEIKIIDNVQSQVSNASYRIGFSSFTLYDYLINQGVTQIQNATYFTIGGSVGYSDNSAFTWYDNNLNYLYRTNLPLSIDIVNDLTFVSTTVNTSSPAYFTDSFKNLINVFNNVIVYQDTLDNAFDYSLSEFIENNNTGLIDFVGLFSGMFLGNANAENSLYLGFANFMMNYSLFVSCAYFVFEVLMWFINYARKWLYAFEEKGGAE